MPIEHSKPFIEELYHKGLSFATAKYDFNLLKTNLVQNIKFNIDCLFTFTTRNEKEAVKKHKFFCSPFLGDRKKRCRTDKLSKIKASDLILLARRRTRVRRVAKFVRSRKHNFFINFRFSLF